MEAGLKYWNAMIKRSKIRAKEKNQLSYYKYGITVTNFF